MTEKAETIEFAVDALHAGERLDRVVAIEVELSRTLAKSLIESGAVLVDGLQVPAKTKVVTGTTVQVTMAAGPGGPEPEDIPFDVVFTDEDIAVIAKPPGVVVHPGAGNPNGTLVSGLMYRDIALLGADHRWGIVHRLDRGTSGLLVVARSPYAHETLQRMLKERTVRRTYASLAFGRFGQATGTIDAPIGRNPKRPVQMAVVRGGRDARTHYRRLAEWELVTLLDVTLETGRTHQIRVHLASIGHPVVGDSVYGKGATSQGDPGRVFLHARVLAFDHPITGTPLTFSVPLPDDLIGGLERLGEPVAGAVAFPD